MEEGVYTIPVNPNIATSEGLADNVHFLPVSPKFCRRIIECGRADDICVVSGGNPALDVGIKS